MSLKTKLGLGLVTASLGLSLVGGGTFAYFNDTVQTTGTFAAGTLDINANPTAIVNVANIKPGDRMLRAFELENDGTLDIRRVLLSTNYSVINKAGAPANVDDFGKHIRVNFLLNADKTDDVIFSTTLHALQGMTPDAVENAFFIPWFDETRGLKAGTTDTFYVQYEFVDNGADQNEFQGDSLQLNWTFEAKQGPGSDL